MMSLILRHLCGTGMINYLSFAEEALPIELKKDTVVKPHYHSDGTWYGNLSKEEAPATNSKVGKLYEKAPPGSPNAKKVTKKVKKTWDSPTKHMRNNWSIAPTGNEETEALDSLAYEQQLGRARERTTDEKRARAQQEKQSWGEGPEPQPSPFTVAATGFDPNLAQKKELTDTVMKKVSGKAKRLRAAFRIFDSNKTGTVTPHDFKQALWNLGVHVSDPEIARMVSR